MTSNTITPQDIEQYIEHWLSTGINGYLGSSYGQDIKSLLQLAQNNGRMDILLDKLRSDLIVFTAFPADAINVYAQQTSIDSQNIIIQIGNISVSVGV